MEPQCSRRIIFLQFPARQKTAYLTTNIIEPPAVGENSGFFRLDVFFNGHVFELTGFKNVATFLAFNKLSVFFTRDDTYTRMPADSLHRYWFGRTVRDG